MSFINRIVTRCFKIYGRPLGVNACKEDLKNEESLFNGVKILSAGGSSPVVRFGFAVQAGSRYENFRERGSTHFLRAMSACSTNKATLIEMNKHIEHLGGYYRVTSTRDFVVFWVDCLKDKLTQIAPLLIQAAFFPQFYAWELEDSRSRVQLEIDIHKSSLVDRLSELSHKSAFKGGLSNGLVISEANLDKFWNSKLVDFHSKNFSSNRASIISAGGVDEQFLIDLGEKIPQSQSDPTECSKFYPREIREEYPGSATYVSFSFAACSSLQLELVRFILLEEILGSANTNLFNGQRYLQNEVETECKHVIIIRCQTIAYSNNGMFTINLNCSGDDANKAVISIVRKLKEIAQGGVTNLQDMLQTAKSKTKMNLLYNLESPFALAESLALGDINKLHFNNRAETNNMLEATTIHHIQEMLKSMISTGYGFAALGNLSNVPYLDEQSL